MFEGGPTGCNEADYCFFGVGLIIPILKFRVAGLRYCDSWFWFSLSLFRNPVHRSIQVSADCSVHEINTFRAEYLSQGMNHFEGGWPKDINPAENDQTMRFRKKIEKDDGYINSVLSLCQVNIIILVMWIGYSKTGF